MSRYPLIVFGDVEQLLVEHLKSELAEPGLPAYTLGAEVGTFVPKPRPPVFVLVRRVGGGRVAISVDAPRVDLQVWHDNDVDAHDLMQLVRGFAHRARGVGGIRSVRDNSGPIPTPDDDGTPRYLMTLDLTLKGATA